MWEQKGTWHVQWWLRSQLLNADSHDFCSPVVTLIILKRMLITRFNREANSEHCTSSYPATQRVVTCSWLFVEAFMTRVKIKSSDTGIKVIAGLQKSCESMIRRKCGCHNSCCSNFFSSQSQMQYTSDYPMLAWATTTYKAFEAQLTCMGYYYLRSFRSPVNLYGLLLPTKLLKPS